jgi:hypothetical protein
MQMYINFYASGLKKCAAISIPNVITVAEAMLISRVKKAFIKSKF